LGPDVVGRSKVSRRSFAVAGVEAGMIGLHVAS
jgi:hypothetical protein